MTIGPAVFEGRIETLDIARKLHAQAVAAGISAVFATFRDPRDAVLASCLFSAPGFVAIPHAGDPDRLADGALRIRFSAEETLVIVGERYKPVPGSRICTVIAASAVASPAHICQVAIEVFAVTGKEPLVVADDCFVLQALRDAGTPGILLELSELPGAITRSGSVWVHMLTEHARIGASYRKLLEQSTDSAWPSHRVLALGVDLLRRDVVLDVRYQAGDGLTSFYRNRLELGPLAYLVPLQSFVGLVRKSDSATALLDQFGLGGIGSGASLPLAIDTPALSVGSCIVGPSRHWQLGYGWSQIADAEKRAAAQAAMLLQSDAPEDLLREIMRFEVIQQAAVDGMPLTNVAEVITGQFQKLLDLLEAEATTKLGVAATEATQDLLLDSKKLAEVFVLQHDGLTFDFARLTEHPQFFTANPGALLRREAIGPTDLIVDALVEGTAATTSRLARRWPRRALYAAPAAELRKLARFNSANDILLYLAALDTQGALADASTLQGAIATGQAGDHLGAAAGFARTFLRRLDVDAITGVAHSLALLGLTKPAEAICLSSLHQETDHSLLIDNLLDVVLPPTLKGDRLPGILKDLSVKPAQQEKIIHRLIDAGDAAQAESQLKQLQHDGLLPSLDLELRLLQAKADWGAIVRRCQRGDMASPRRERETATAIANLGSLEEAEAYLRSTAVAPVIQRSIMAFLKLQFGRESEAIAVFEEAAREELGTDIAGAKREILHEVARRSDMAGAAALAQDMLLTEDLSWELKLFFCGRFCDAAGKMEQAASFYREAMLGLNAPNWLRTLMIFMLHRCFHYTGRHEEALDLFTAFQRDNGSFGALLDENYLQLRQTYLLLNGMRSKSSLRGPQLTIDSGDEIDRDAVERIAATIAEVRREQPEAFILIFAFQTGDAYLILYFLKKLAELHHLKPESIVALTLKRLRPIVGMFEDRIGRIIEIEPHNAFVLHQRLAAFNDDRVRIAHPEFLTFRSDGTAYTHQFEADFMLQSKRALGLPVNHGGDHPPEQKGAKPVLSGPSIFLSPMSNSFQLLSAEFWNDLAAAAKAKGFHVYVNKGPEGDSGVKGAEPVDLPHRELRGFLDAMTCVIGLRSGLLDVTSATSAPMIVYYPVPGQAMPWPHMWTLRTMRDPELTEEIIFEAATFDKAGLLIDTLARLDNFSSKRKH